MRPRISTELHRWCPQCQAVTRSVMCCNGHDDMEICASEPCPYCDPGED